MLLCYCVVNILASLASGPVAGECAADATDECPNRRANSSEKCSNRCTTSGSGLAAGPSPRPAASYSRSGLRFVLGGCYSIGIVYGPSDEHNAAGDTKTGAQR